MQRAREAASAPAAAASGRVSVDDATALTSSSTSFPAKNVLPNGAAAPVADARDHDHRPDLLLLAAAARHEELSAAAARAQTSLRAELAAARDAARAELDALAKRHAVAAARVERAARALAVRAMELDNRALELERDETAVAERERASDSVRVAADEAKVAARETEKRLEAREASLRYSAVEQSRLHDWAKQLEEREIRVGDAETAEKERIAARIAAVARRELLVAERERRVDAALQEREVTLARREAGAEAVQETLNRQRSEAMLQLEAERAEFWTHQQKLSAVVAAETEALLAEQAKLRTEFEGEAAAARKALREMADSVVSMKLRIEDAQTAIRAMGNNNDFADELARLTLNELEIQEEEEVGTPVEVENETEPG